MMGSCVSSNNAATPDSKFSPVPDENNANIVLVSQRPSLIPIHAMVLFGSEMGNSEEIARMVHAEVYWLVN